MFTMPTDTEQETNTPKQNAVQRFIHAWAENNIFRFKRWDATTYAILYIVVPVLVAFASLLTLPTEYSAAAYCYFSIAISAANCIYDACSRWESNISSLRNAKLGSIIFVSFIALSYSFFQFIVILTGKTLAFRYDQVLLFYLLAVLIASLDFIALFAKDMALFTVIKN